jgi:hypothetical protein
LPLTGEKKKPNEKSEIAFGIVLMEGTVAACISGRICYLDMPKNTTRNLGEHSR